MSKKMSYDILKLAIMVNVGNQSKFHGYIRMFYNDFPYQYFEKGPMIFEYLI